LENINNPTIRALAATEPKCKISSINKILSEDVDDDGKKEFDTLEIFYGFRSGDSKETTASLWPLF